MGKGKLIVIAGPTAVGKTSISIELAKVLQTEIISADSRQFYKELTIGTAKPGKSELKAVKHHFINNLSVRDSIHYTASSYEAEVMELLRMKFEKLPVMIMTGGSGLFIDAVTMGFDENIPPADEKIREEIQKLYQKDGIEGLQQKLKELDPKFYSEVDLNNSKRLSRAIEVCVISGQPFSSLRKGKKRKRDFEVVQIGLEMDRELLFQQINNRVDKMIEEGLEDEVSSLIKYRNVNALKTVGYTEFFNYFDKMYNRDEAIEKIKVNTRRYAKRQLTWFKKNPNYSWFNPEMKDQIINYALNFTA